MRFTNYAFLVLLLCYPQAAFTAERDDETKKSIQARYDQFDQAYMKKDFKTIANIYGENCVLKLIGEGRSMNAQRAIAGMRVLSKSLTVSHAKTEIASFKSVGDGFEVSVIWTGESKYVPLKEAKEDPPRKARVKQLYRDTWKKSANGWQITYRQIGDSDEDAKPEPKKH